MSVHYPQIALQKSLCLLLVIFTHALLPFAPPNPFWTLYADAPAQGAGGLATLFSVILIPSFVFASGFLFENTLQIKRYGFWAMLASRTRRLLLPWFLVMLFWLAPLYVYFDIPVFMRPAGTPLVDTYILGLKGQFVDHLWFLPVLFWTTLFWLLCRPFLRPGMHRPEAPRWAGWALAFAAALIMQVFGSGLTWFCLWETTGPLIQFYLGMRVYPYRDRLDALLAACPMLVSFVLVAPMLLLLPYAYSHFLLTWLLGLCGALFMYTLCFFVSRRLYPRMKKNRVWAFYESNAFRFYLFHMPTPLVAFALLYPTGMFSPWACIFCVTVITLAVTAAVVYASRGLQNMGPRILERMRHHG